MPTATAILGLNKPTVGADNNTWGGFLNGDLDQLDALWTTIGNVPFGGCATKPLTFFMVGGNNLSEITNATTARTNLGLGSAAQAATGTSGHTVPFLDGANAWSAAQTFSAGITANVTGNVTGSSGSCTGNAASASTAAACSGNAATASNAAACSGNSASTTQLGSTGTGGTNACVWDDTNGQWVFYVRGAAVAVVNNRGFVNLV